MTHCPRPVGSELRMVVLSAVAHGKDAGAEHIARAALAGCAALDNPLDWVYADLVRASLSETATRALEAMMDVSKYELQSEFARKHFGQGVLEGRRTQFLELLDLRFGAVPPEVAARVHAADTAQIDHWLRRILTASTREAVLDDMPAAAPAGGVGQDA